ncbi:MAG: UDP-N-acetylglucosamine 2-epimerase (non-hydrolyzing) [Betaproteobacteria bacterium]
MSATSPLVLVFAGTRPEAIKVAPVVRAFGAQTHWCAEIVNSGQHALAVRSTLAELGLQADVELGALPALPNLATAFDHLRRELAAVIARRRPAAVIVQGDTLTAHAAAVAGRESGRLVAHVEAGLRTESVSDPFPEEWFRRRIARVADLHFAPTQRAADNLVGEGIAPSRVFHTGNTGIDSLKRVLAEPRIAQRTELGTRNRILVTLHRRENHDSNADVVCRALVRLVEARPHMRVTFPVHPNPRVAMPIRRRLGAHPAFDLVAPMAYRDFVFAAVDAALIVSDSGGIQEEAPHLGTPLLVPRSNTERPEAIATGFVALVPIDAAAIVAAACAALDAPRRAPLPIDAAAPFGAGDAGDRIARIVAESIAQRVSA